MIENNTKTEKNQNKNRVEDEVQSKSTVDLSRRRLAKAGLIVLPVLSTLPGKPAMATYAKNNCTVSGNLSGNMSHNVNNTDPCDGLTGGKSVSYWAALDPDSGWPAGYGRTSKFHDFFGGNHQQKPNGNSFRLRRVLKNNGNIDAFSLDAEAAAALLNAETYTDYGYTPIEVVDMYNLYRDSSPADQQALKQAFKYLNDKG